MDFINYIILFSILLAAIIQLAFALSTSQVDEVQGGTNTVIQSSKIHRPESVQILVLTLFFVIVMTRAGLIADWFDFASRILIWFVVGFFIVGSFVFLTSANPREKRILGPLNLFMLALSILNALS